MNIAIKQHIQSTLHHLYISPLEGCNLHCAMCYTRKSSTILPKEKIQMFISRYRKEHLLESITFCGGEVFVLPWFIDLVNELTKEGMLIQIITNGSIDRLDEFRDPNSINLIVSIDGLERYHDQNRGNGTFTKSVKFLQKAHQNGFHTEVFSILTRENIAHIIEFEQFLHKELYDGIEITYHPRKPTSYLNNHPVSNVVGVTKGFGFLEKDQLQKMFSTKKTFPPKNLGCYQISLMSDGNIYGCCEGIQPLGSIDDPIKEIIDRFINRINTWYPNNYSKNCLGCIENNFVCGFAESFKKNQVRL
jgi:MoaA/NifB/PqqE/SkfB family radical SAM enzyme